MNVKVVNLVAIQFGIFVGILCWLAYSRLPFAEPRTEGEPRESALNAGANVAAVFEPRRPLSHPTNYRTDRERAQPVDEQPAPMAPEYDQAIAPQAYANSVPDNGSIAVNSPSYAQVDQEAVIPSDNLESAQAVVYSQPIETVVYAQPTQIIVFSNPRHFGNRCQSKPHFGAPSTIRPQCPDRRNFRPDDTRVVPPPNVRPPADPPVPGSRPRGTVRPTGVTSSQPRRVAFPASPGAAQRLVP